MAAINILNAILMVIASIFTFTLLKFEIAANWIFLIVALFSLVVTPLGFLLFQRCFGGFGNPKLIEQIFLYSFDEPYDEVFLI